MLLKFFSTNRNIFEISDHKKWAEHKCVYKGTGLTKVLPNVRHIFRRILSTENMRFFDKTAFIATKERCLTYMKLIVKHSMRKIR